MASMEMVEMPVAAVLAGWRPGSADWSWAEECADLLGRDGVRTAALAARLGDEVSGDPDHPIHLGPDGRVWDGHHRIVIAVGRGTETLRCLIHTDHYDAARRATARVEGD